MTDRQYTRRGLIRWSGAAGLGAAGLAVLPPGLARAAEPAGSADPAAVTGPDAAAQPAGDAAPGAFDPIRPPATPLAVRSPT
ncbi:hypothetical protein ACFQZC_03840 [Streptacidiphilus monticola]